MIRKIVIPVRGDGKGDNVFSHAVVMARRFKAQVVVTHCRPRAEDLMPYGVAIPSKLKTLLLSQSADVADQVEDGLRVELQALAARLNIPLVDKYEPDKATATWVEEQGRQVDIIKRHGRLADLVCVAKPDVDRNLGANTLKAALFNTGRPIMMCPPTDQVSDTLCDHVAVAWNGSIESSRAIALTEAILKQAKSVSILTIGPPAAGLDATVLKDYLAIREVEATVVSMPSTRNIGQSLLKECENIGADSMIMGAYSNSHERETVFGGTTQHIVDTAERPIIFVH